MISASHTIGVSHLAELLRAAPVDAPTEQYRDAVVEENVLGRPPHTDHSTRSGTS